MSYTTQLKHLLQNELIPDVQALVEDMKTTDDATIADMQELYMEYKELLAELVGGQIDEDEAEQIYTDLTAMQEGADDDNSYDYDDEEEEDEDDYEELDLNDEDENY